MLAAAHFFTVWKQKLLVKNTGKNKSLTMVREKIEKYKVEGRVKNSKCVKDRETRTIWGGGRIRSRHRKRPDENQDS